LNAAYRSTKLIVLKSETSAFWNKGEESVKKKSSSRWPVLRVGDFVSVEASNEAGNVFSKTQRVCLCTQPSRMLEIAVSENFPLLVIAKARSLAARPTRSCKSPYLPIVLSAFFGVVVRMLDILGALNNQLAVQAAGARVSTSISLSPCSLGVKWASGYPGLFWPGLRTLKSIARFLELPAI
jgi:hypothetical protein